jgi:hypothetical protein
MTDKLRECPFCGGEDIYEISREDSVVDKIPQLFCNSCKMIFEVENDSPFLDDTKTFEYLKEKLHTTWNTRKPMDRIVEQLEGLPNVNSDYWNTSDLIDREDAIEIVKGGDL